MFIFNGTDVFETDRSIGLRNDFRLGVLGSCSTADVECSHGQLGSRLTDGLCRDNTESIADLRHSVAGEVAAVALHANAMLDFAGENRADQNTLNVAFLDQVCKFRSEFLSGLDQKTSVFVDRVADILGAAATDQTCLQRQHHIVAFDDCADPDTLHRSAIFRTADDILRNVDELTGHVTRVSGLQSGICETLAGAVGTDEVFENGETFTEVRQNRTFDNIARRLCHQSAHTGKLTNLVFTASSSGIEHAVDRVDLLLADAFEFLEQRLGNRVTGLGPRINNIVITFQLGESTLVVLVVDLVDLGARLRNQFAFLFRDHHVRNGDGESGDSRVLVAEVFQTVELFDGLLMTDVRISLRDKGAELFLLGNAVVESEALVPDAVENATAGSRQKETVFGIAVRRFHSVIRVRDADRIMDMNMSEVQSKQHFVNILERSRLRGIARLNRQIIRTERNILRRGHDRFAVCRREDVVRGEHQEFALELCSRGQRNMNRHLVTVEVRVERSTDKRMQTDRRTFNEDRVERLNRKSVQGRRTVEHDRMSFGHLFENIPDDRLSTLDHFLCAADGVSITATFEVADNKRLKQNKRHLLRKTALCEFQFRTDNDDRTSGVVNTFTEQVLTETSLLAFQHIAEGLQSTVSGAGDGTTVASVVQKSVDRFLKHTLFVADNDFRGTKLKQVFQTVVAVNDSAVEVVQVGGRETAAFQRNERTQIRRNHRKNFEDHPFRTGIASLETFHETQSLGKFLADRLVFCSGQFNFELLTERFKVNLRKQRTDCRRTHICLERILILFARLTVVHLIEGLTESQRGVARIGDNPVFIIDDALKRAGRHIKHETDTARHTLEEPDVGDRNCEFDVTHTFTANLAQRNFNTAAVADDAFMLDAFVFSAVALPVALGTEDALAEETALFGLEASVVDGFWILDFPMAPGPDHFRGSHLDGDRLESGISLLLTSRDFLVFGNIAVINHCSVPPAVSFFGNSECLTVRTSKPRLCISLSRTLKDSGRPASRTFCPLTMDS